MDKYITRTSAPPLGDVRRYRRGVTVWLSTDADTREDWSRYLDALGSALARGADVRWMR